ncbi:TRAP transporter substrate-binding protein [Peptoniphilus equinus]|uniref:TRAP transporter substrate-binding protein n=1 Tax=Peptoniphilus equinus TaxID=3016343 RepID=A0ABY7QVT1_9FIRM|nr:TRAP transporter substrate-binding protein [Peptoniphilus equinus]WBW50170.1 TRAP transporter substrate-binding protein [Peptoniphilus equinus]
MKKSLFAILALMMVFVTACGGNQAADSSAQGNEPAATEASADAVTIKIGHVEPENRSTHRALLEFKKNVEEKSNGSLVIEIYPNGALGGDVQLTESTAMGTLDVALPSTSVLTTYSDEFGILDMPYLFKNSESAFTALDGELGQQLNAKLEGNGLINLGYAYNGIRSTTTNTGAIERPADLQGVKMRVMESPIFIDFYKTLGANPTPISFTELYTGLQQGTVDAQENPPSLTYANKFYEVQKFLTVDEHIHNFLPFLMNQTKFDGLTSEQQELLRTEVKAFVENQRQMELADNDAAIEKLKTEGNLTTNVLSDEQKQAFKDALKPMYDKYREQFGAELFDLAESFNQ